MTKEEAIEHNKNLRMYMQVNDKNQSYMQLTGYKFLEENYIALDMAIKALEQQPCEDAISRRDALDALHMCLATNSYNEAVTGDSYICYEEAEYEIENLQSVRPKPKTGHWIEQIDHEENCRTLICSNCDRPALHDGNSIWKHKFCPHCGAKMVEPQESEDKE